MPTPSPAPRALRARRGAAMVLALGVLSAAPGGGRGLSAQDVVGLHGVHARSHDPEESEGATFLSLRLDSRLPLGNWELRIAGEAWLDVARPSASLVAPSEVGLRRGWDGGEIFLGAGSPAWGLSRFRSPAAAFAPRAALWSVLTGPPLGGPMAALRLFPDWGEIELLFLPARRAFQESRLVRRTWGGSEVDPSTGMDPRADYGVRLWRSFQSADVAVWWMDGTDGRGWVRAREGEGAAVFHQPRMRQAGWEAEYVAGELVLRSEGGVMRRDGAWHSRVLAGADWFATPYLTVFLEQGFATDAHEAESPLVDDTLLGAELLTERLRVEAGGAVDPRTATVHPWMGVRWVTGSRTALEATWVGAFGSPGDEPEFALRQPGAVSIGGVLFF